MYSATPAAVRRLRQQQLLFGRAPIVVGDHARECAPVGDQEIVDVVIHGYIVQATQKRLQITQHHAQAQC